MTRAAQAMTASAMIAPAMAALAMVAAMVSVGQADVLANETFESLAAQAVRVRSVEDLVWPLTASCDRGDDVSQRQCRIVRDRKAKLRRRGR